MQFSVSNDGVAFRYTFPESSATLHKIQSEASSFSFPAETKAWLQPVAVARSGWASTNPSYEEIYEKDIALGTPSPTGAGWIYPALFHTPDAWVLISETGLTRNYSGTRLQSTWRSPEYTVVLPDPLEHFQNGAVAPSNAAVDDAVAHRRDRRSRRRSLESTLGTDLAEKPSGSDQRSTRTGPANRPGAGRCSATIKTDYETQKRFIDYAAEMGWAYTLVDALWDTQIGYDRLKELVDYAAHEECPHSGLVQLRR